MSRRRTLRVENVASVLSLLLALVASVLLAVIPSYHFSSATADSSATATVSTRSETLVEVNGGGVLAALLLPVVVAAVPVLLRRSWARATAAVLLTGFAFMTGFSIGLYYLPSALVMAGAAAQGWGRPGNGT